jgi:predicted nucleic acid-binding protein
MIFPDTSVWIEFFKNHDPYFKILKLNLEINNVISHEIIFAELLQGAKSEREFKIILEYWENINKINSDGSIIDGGIYSYKSNLINKGIGLVDSVLLSSTLKKMVHFIGYVCET